MPVLPFKSDAEVAEFAKKFLDEHVERISHKHIVAEMGVTRATLSLAALEREGLVE